MDIGRREATEYIVVVGDDDKPADVEEFIAARVGGLTSDRFRVGALRYVWNAHFPSEPSRDDTFSLCCGCGKYLLTGDRILKEVLSTLCLSFSRAKNRRFQRGAWKYNRAMAFVSPITWFRGISMTRTLAFCPASPNISSATRTQVGHHSQVLSAILCRHPTGDLGVTMFIRIRL